MEYTTLAINIKLTNPPLWFAKLERLYNLLSQKAHQKCKEFSEIPVEKRPISPKTGKTISYQSIAYIHDISAPSRLKDCISSELGAEWKSYQGLLQKYFKLPKEKRKHLRKPKPPEYVYKPRFLIRNTGININVDNQILTINLPWKEENKLKTDIKFVCGKWQKDRLYGALSFGETEFIRKGNEWYANISARYIKTKREIDDEEHVTYIAIHTGIYKLISALAICNGKFNVKYWDGGQFWHKRRHFSELRQILGKKKKRLKIKAMGQKERRFVQWHLHNLSNEVIKWIFEQSKIFNTTNIQIIIGRHKGLRVDSERKNLWKPLIKDLKKNEYINLMRQLNWMLSRYPFASLLNKLQYKLELAGLPYQIKDEKDLKISLYCYKCGRETDLVGRFVECRCGKYFVEWNALRNLLKDKGNGKISKMKRDLIQLKMVKKDQKL